MPSVLMLKDTEAAFATVVGMVCAPLALYVICLTPEPLAFSAEISDTATLVLFQPLAFGPGEAATVVTGLMLTVTVAVAMPTFPELSLKRKVMVVVPIAN